jgi:hypothetical protein
MQEGGTGLLVEIMSSMKENKLIHCESDFDVTIVVFTLPALAWLWPTVWQCKQTLFIYLFIYLALPTRAGSPQQHIMPITVGPFFFYLTHPVNFPCGRKPEYPGKTHDFRQSVDFLLFSHEDWVRVALRKYLVRFEPAASEVKGKCANHLATEAP